MARGEEERAAANAAKDERYREIRNRYSILPKDKDGHDFDNIQKLSNSDWLKAQYEKDPEHFAESILSTMKAAEERIQAEYTERMERITSQSQDEPQNELDPTRADLTKGKVNSFICNRIQLYKDEECANYKLWEYFKEDFEGWTSKTFLLGDKDLVRKLRNFLREYGCWVNKETGKRVSEALEEVVRSDDYYKWTKEEIKDQTKYNNLKNKTDLPKEQIPIQPLQEDAISLPQSLQTMNLRPQDRRQQEFPYEDRFLPQDRFLPHERTLPQERIPRNSP
ncbi:hypothetical protein EG329_010768, partial [Mollisiaceae sp. DMI_Dod_QoI]